MSTAPLCKDCKHYREAQTASFDRCTKRTISPALPLVRGEQSASFGFCEQTRESPSNCGPEGKWFEPKESA